MLVFVEGEKLVYLGKNLLEQGRGTNNKLNPCTYGVNARNRIRATLVGGKCSHHCGIPAPPVCCGLHFVSFLFPILPKGFKVFTGQSAQSPSPENTAW